MPERLNGLVIDDRLDELDVSPNEFAARHEISEGYFRNLRNGHDLCSRRMAHRIARGLALPVEQVISESVTDGRRERAKKKDERKDEPTGPVKRQDKEKQTGPRRAAAETRL